jgi:hypothetical protein
MPHPLIGAQFAIKVLAVALVPTTGAAPVQVYTAPNPAPYVDLEQLDHMGALLADAQVPAGSYSGAIVTLGANPGDVALTASEDPETGFAAAASSSIPAQAIQVQGSQGSSGAMRATVSVPFAVPFAVSAKSALHPLDLDFSLSHPAMVQSQTPVTNDPTLWAVDFQGPVTGQAIASITQLVLQQVYGTLSSVAADDRSLTITRSYPAEPVTNPETATSSSQLQTLLADTGNGTQFYDLDAGDSMIISNFTGLAGLTAGRYLRVAARYQPDGSLVATRIWISDSFQTVWSSPEGHVMQVDANHDTLAVEDDSGHSVPVTISADTEFDYQGVPIATGTAFPGGHIERGFKVHVNPG